MKKISYNYYKLISNIKYENEDYSKDSTSYKTLKKKNEFSKENSNINIIY